MLDGKVRFLVGEEISLASKATSSSCRATRAMPLASRPRPRCSSTATPPPGLEMAVAEHALPAPSRTLPPKGATPPPAMTPELMRRYGMDNLPGPNPIRPDGHRGKTGMTMDADITTQRVSDGAAVERFTLTVPQAGLDDLARSSNGPAGSRPKRSTIRASARCLPNSRRSSRAGATTNTLGALNSFGKYHLQIDGLGPSHSGRGNSGIRGAARPLSGAPS